MAQQQKTSRRLMHTPPSAPQAQLWVGSPNILMEKLMPYLQKQMCTKGGCKKCASCRQVREQQHHAITWIEPAKQYTRSDLQDVFNTIVFALNADQRHFFILHNTDFLTAVCANSLLKPIEEPPTGYYFILLAERLDLVLPTIRSRCAIITHTHAKNKIKHETLFTHLNSKKMPHPISFLKDLDQSKINERESIELLDALLAHWTSTYKTALQENNRQKATSANHAIELLQNFLIKPPMPGSSKIFWKEIFLQLHSS